MTMGLATFDSFPDFLKRMAGLFTGPTFISCFRNIDPVFREKLLLAVSIADNCGG
jgi:hypothetical protein